MKQTYANGNTVEIVFTDGGTAAVERVTWNPYFQTGVTQRGPYTRIIFITDGRVHSDPWVRDTVVVRLAREVGR